VRFVRRFRAVKQENGAGAALFARNEWEQDIRARQPDLDAARDTALAPLLTKKLREGLKPVFKTSVRRKVFQLLRIKGELGQERGWIAGSRAGRGAFPPLARLGVSPAGVGLGAAGGHEPRATVAGLGAQPRGLRSAGVGLRTLHGRICHD
jgi:hypothetical protein